MNKNATLFIGKPSIKSFFRKLALSVVLLTGAGGTVEAQYCIPSWFTGCSSNDDLNSFSLTGQGASTISDLNTGCGPLNGYEDKTTTIPPVDLMQGGTYTGTATTNFGSDEYLQIWIDLDSNMVFDPSEAVMPVYGPFGLSNPANFSISLPITAPVGLRRMRAMVVYNQWMSIDPCGGYSFGEVHDYMVNILPAPPCSGTPAITAISPAGPVVSCAGATQTISITVPIASGYSFQWQQSVNGGVTWTNVGTNSTSYTFSVTGNADYRVYVTCNASNLSDTSAVVTVTATPPTYAALPYFQDFESWTNYCSTSDIPDGAGTNWTNSPSTGDSSWRRDDQGATANWSATWGTYFPSSISGIHSARFPSVTQPSSRGNLDLYLDASQQTGNKALYFYFINDNTFGGGDSLTIWLSDNGGSSFSQIGSFDSAFAWKKRYVDVPSNSAQTIIRFQGKVINWDGSDIGLDSVYVAQPCTGTPLAGTLNPAGPVSGCPGNSYTLESIGGSMAGNLGYQWQQSIDNGSSWTNVPGGDFLYTTPALYDTTLFRLIVTCNGSGLADTTDPVVFNISSPLYASLPYIQDFEGWQSFCDVSDVPSLNWLNKPETGDLSWRRDDEGATANWINPAGGMYSTPSFTGNHSARFHTWFANWSSWGDLDLFIDCSIPGTKELQFHHINESGSDEIQIWLSTDGGATFSQLQSWTTAVTWTLRSLPIVSNSAQTVIRFRAVSDFSDDIGIDNVKVLMPCAGTPDAGSIDSLVACSGQDFNLTTTGTTLAGGITYQWQESPNGATFTDIPGANQSSYVGNITSPTWYRLIVNCTNSGVADTTNALLVQLGDFYFCYCHSAAQGTAGSDIGNVLIRRQPSNTIVLNNGVATPLTNNPAADKASTNFTLLPPTDLYLDSVYRFTVTQITSGPYEPAVVAIYMDLDTNGVFHPTNEKIMQRSTSLNTQTATDTFRIPANAPIGITGMRVVLVEGAFAFPDPCLSYNVGETEDYLVYINYPPCDGATNPGVARISDTLLCPGFPFTLTDTTHEKFRSQMTWNWQESTDGIIWTDIPGTDSMDVVNMISGTVKTWYRLAMHCGATSTSTYSLPVYLNIKAPYECYCESFANGGSSDMTDVGAFTIGNYIFNAGGPPLNNPVAVKAHTGYPGPVITLYTDSTYQLSLYQIMRDGNHQDAKVTLFIDFNNNFVYDTPEERVWTAYTNSTDIFINGTVDIPNTAVTNIATGMRLIINNDTGPNVPSDEACGPYFSGETEDFAVKIMPKGSMSVPGVNTGQFSFELYPNPSTGLVSVNLSSWKANETATLSVYTMTGQLVHQQEMKTIKGQTQATMDLTGWSRGVYLVELRAEGQKQVKKLSLQ